jgi:hypothetical protein
MPLDPTRVRAVFLKAVARRDLVDRGAIVDRGCSANPALAGASKRS